MTEPKVGAMAAATDLREWKRMMLDAASRGPTAVDDATGTVYVLRYRDVERLLHDPRLHGIGLLLFDHMGIAEGPLRDWFGSLMFTTDGAGHDRLRRLVSKAFTPRAVERLRPSAAALVAEALSKLRRSGGGDLTGALAHVPMHVMCSLLGVPIEAVPHFIAWVNALSPAFGLMTPAQIVAAESAITELLDYVRKLVDQRSRATADDLITGLIRAEHEGQRLTRDETVNMVVNLLVGGHDTTSSQIGCTLLTLLARPETLTEVRAEPALLGSLVSETMRFETSIGAAPRTTTEPIEICGIERPAGTILVCTFLAANRDPAVWHDPDSFVSRRFEDPGAPRLLSFGGGPHYCLGAALARMTIEEAARGVAELAPVLAEAPDRIEWSQVLGRSPASVPVTF